MFNKSVASISAICSIFALTLPLFTLPAFANTRVVAVRNCMTYNFNGQPVNPLRIGDKYFFYNVRKFSDGESGLVILVHDNQHNRNGFVVARASCFRRNQQGVIHY